MSFVRINDLRLGPLKPLGTVHPVYGTGFPLPSRHCILYNAHLRQECQHKIWHFSVTDIEGSICRCTFNRYNVVCKTRRWRVVVSSSHSQKVMALQNL
jgi:hypothetical protein